MDCLYLDICSFKRPFDDASAERVRREAEAVAGILDAAAKGTIKLVRSPAHDLENDRNPREDRRLATLLWLDSAALRVSATAGTAARARELSAMGFAPLDALHLAFAEESQAICFVTTDDQILKRARALGKQLRLQVLKPDDLSLSPEGEEK